MEKKKYWIYAATNSSTYKKFIGVSNTIKGAERIAKKTAYLYFPPEQVKIYVISADTGKTVEVFQNIYH